jgi:hypothetical protein
MNEEQIFKWSKSIAKGKLRFVLVEGILNTGLPFAVFVWSAGYVDKYGFTIPYVDAYFWRSK